MSHQDITISTHHHIQTVATPAARSTARLTAVFAICTLYSLPLIGFASLTAASAAAAAAASSSVFPASAASAAFDRQGTGATAPNTTRADPIRAPFIVITTVAKASGQSCDALY